jgi:hypothetical protein
MVVSAIHQKGQRQQCNRCPNPGGSHIAVQDRCHVRAAPRAISATTRKKRAPRPISEAMVKGQQGPSTGCRLPIRKNGGYRSFCSPLSLLCSIRRTTIAAEIAATDCCDRTTHGQFLGGRLLPARLPSWGTSRSCAMWRSSAQPMRSAARSMATSRSPWMSSTVRGRSALEAHFDAATLVFVPRAGH